MDHRPAVHVDGSGVWIRAFLQTPSEVIHSLWAAVQEMNYNSVSHIRLRPMQGCPAKLGLHCSSGVSARVRRDLGAFSSLMTNRVLQPDETLLAYSVTL